MFPAVIVVDIFLSTPTLHCGLSTIEKRTIYQLTTKIVTKTYFNEDRAILTDPDPEDVFLAEVSDVEYDEDDEDFLCAEDPDL